MTNFWYIHVNIFTQHINDQTTRIQVRSPVDCRRPCLPDRIMRWFRRRSRLWLWHMPHPPADRQSIARQCQVQITYEFKAQRQWESAVPCPWASLEKLWNSVFRWSKLTCPSAKKLEIKWQRLNYKVSLEIIEIFKKKIISIHKPPASIRFAPIKHALAVTVEPFKFSPA